MANASPEASEALSLSKPYTMQLRNDLQVDQKDNSLFQNARAQDLLKANTTLDTHFGKLEISDGVEMSTIPYKKPLPIKMPEYEHVIDPNSAKQAVGQGEGHSASDAAHK